MLATFVVLGVVFFLALVVALTFSRKPKAQRQEIHFNAPTSAGSWRQLEGRTNRIPGKSVDFGHKPAVYSKEQPVTTSGADMLLLTMALSDHTSSPPSSSSDYSSSSSDYSNSSSDYSSSSSDFGGGSSSGGGGGSDW